MDKVIIAGGSGFLGQVIAKSLVKRNFEVVVLSRGSEKIENGVRFIQWDGSNLGEWTKQLEGAKALINLTGKTVQVSHNTKNKKEIIESRVNSVRVLNAAIIKSNIPPKVYIQASGISIYKPTNKFSSEPSEQASGFMADVVKLWEGEMNDDVRELTRVITLRFGIALGNEGGAFPLLKKLTKLFLGSSLGSGKQGMSWFHVEDLSRFVISAFSNEKIKGTYNFCSPNPVSNSSFMRLMRKLMNRPWAPRVPSFAVRLIGVLGLGVNPSIALEGVFCSSQKLEKSGFEFKYKMLDEAIEDLLH